jgi:hypothetical protein
MIKKVLVALGALTLVSATLTGCSMEPSGSVDGHDEIHFSDGWVRVSEYSDHEGGMTGAFAKIENHTGNDVTLVGGSAEIAGMVEVHEVVMIDKDLKEYRILKLKLPHVIVLFCNWHVSKTFLKRFKNKELLDSLKEMQYSTDPVEFELAKSK